MTTNDAGSRPVEERDTARPEPDFDDLIAEDELIAEEESYTPPPAREDTSQDAVPIDVIPPTGQATIDDPTPPDAVPQAAPDDAPVGDDRPDVPRDLSGEPTDFEPLRVPEVDSDEVASWQQIQVRFVDDPAAAVGEAAGLVEEAVAGLRSGHDSAEGSGDSTEQLRLAFRRYRAIHELATRPDVP